MTDKPQPLTLAQIGPAVTTALQKAATTEIEVGCLENGRLPSSDVVDTALRAAQVGARAAIKAHGLYSVTFVIEKVGR